MYENYKKYIEEGKCVSCGKRLTEGYAYRRCEECRKAMKLREKDRKEKEKAKTELTKNEGILWKKSHVWQRNGGYLTGRW